MITDPLFSIAIEFRPLDALDKDFSFRVYASTRADEMALVDWTDEQKAAFLWMQFNAQTGHYLTHYPKAEYYILQCEDMAIGRLILERSKHQLLVMDIALLPEYRNAGTRAAIIKDLMKEAGRAGLPLSLHVEFINPAIRLYTRLGFVKTREVNSVYHEMVWTPTQNLSSPRLN